MVSPYLSVIASPSRLGFGRVGGENEQLEGTDSGSRVNAFIGSAIRRVLLIQERIMVIPPSHDMT